MAKKMTIDQGFDSLEEIIASAWNWHQHHPDGYAE